MSKNLTKDDVIKNKKNAIKILNNTLEFFINDNNEKHLKKANLISYWLQSFSMYLRSEETFSPQRLIRYKRGSVIRVNLGFNVGKELGGLHYAVVLDNDNKRNGDVLTIVPLSSTDGKTIHERNVDLGSELYEKISTTQKNLLEKAYHDLRELQKTQIAFRTALEVLAKCEDKEDMPSLEEQKKEIVQRQSDIFQKECELKKTIETLERNESEISKLKIGGMAVVNQITTVSKQRIYAPKRTEDFLHGISLSTTAMDKINAKIKELYVFN